MKRLFKILILIFPILIFADNVNIFSECSAVPETNRVTIAWITEAETAVRYFAVLRSNDDANYIE